MHPILRFATAPVRDPAGRYSWLKAAVLLGTLLPAAVLAARFDAHALGPRPITEAIHATGLWAVRFVLLTLAVTPARAILDWSRVVMLRRLLGVTAAAYAAAHLGLYALDQKWRLGHIAAEIALRFYLTIGFAALLGLAALAVTSTNGWQRRLGPRWKRLHRLIYPLTLLALLHDAIQSKADVTGAIFLFGLFVWLMLWRLLSRRRQQQLWPILPLGLSAGGLAALVEGVWYAVRNHIDPRLVWAANFDLTNGPRPAVWVGLCALALLAAAAFRRRGRRRAVPRAVARQA